MIRCIFAFVCSVLIAQSCFAWSECGHMVIAAIAFDELTKNQQAAIVEVLKKHPMFVGDFAVPEKTSNPGLWLFERSAYWPDLPRQQPRYQRALWHSQSGSILTIGDVSNVPEIPGSCPPDATLETRDLDVVQAVELCRRVMKDKTTSAGDRAIAICWIGNLVGDAHHPCHSGSLYSPAFPEGDKSAASIPTRQSKNLRSFWEALLGTNFDAADVKRRAKEIRIDTAAYDAAKQAAQEPGGLDPVTWLKESAHTARSNVYTAEVLTPVKKLKPGEKLLEIQLSAEYLRQADKAAKKRAAFAALRLAAILREDVCETSINK